MNFHKNSLQEFQEIQLSAKSEAGIFSPKSCFLVCFIPLLNMIILFLTKNKIIKGAVDVLSSDGVVCPKTQMHLEHRYLPNGENCQNRTLFIIRLLLCWSDKGLKVQLWIGPAPYLIEGHLNLVLQSLQVKLLAIIWKLEFYQNPSSIKTFVRI